MSARIIGLALLCTACSELASVDRSDIGRPEPIDAAVEDAGGRPMFVPPTPPVKRDPLPAKDEDAG